MTKGLRLINPTDTSSTNPGKSTSPNLAWQVGAATTSRLLLNTARRFAYPFAPALSRGMGVPLPAITSLIAVNQITGILSMVFGPISDRFGYRVMMLAGMGMLAVGMIAGGFLPFYGVIMVALFLAGLGKSIFDPALQAYVGRRVPYHRRGLIIGIIEMSWSASSLIGIPAVGFLIDRLGWRSPFFVIGGLSLIGLAVLAMLIPNEKAQPAVTGEQITFKSVWRQIKESRVALGALGFALFVSAANDNLFVVYGAWLEDRFGLSIIALGLATTVIGVAELSGESLTALFSDRLGLKRTVTLSLIVSGISYAALPRLEQSLPLALLGLFIIFISVEFSIVTALSLFTEILPEARASMMSAYLAASGIGRVAGSFAGGFIWTAGGINAIGWVSAIVSLAALISLVWGFRHWNR